MESPDRLFQLGCKTLDTLRTDLARHGVDVSPSLELRRGQSLLSHYNTDDGHIYLSTPDPSTPGGRFQLLLLRSLVRLETDEQVLRLLELLIPWLIAHETAHHLRHRYGRLISKPRPADNKQRIDGTIQADEDETGEWTGFAPAARQHEARQREETIANQMASALILPRLSPCQHAELRHLLALTMDNMADGLQKPSPVERAPNTRLDWLEPDSDPLHYVLGHMHWIYQDLHIYQNPRIYQDPHTAELPVLDVWINCYLT